MLENDIWKPGRNLPLTTLGSERVKEKHFVFRKNLVHRKLRTGKPLYGGHASKALQ